jgi:hypothetical protein
MPSGHVPSYAESMITCSQATLSFRGKLFTFTLSLPLCFTAQNENSLISVHLENSKSKENRERAAHNTAWIWQKPVAIAKLKQANAGFPGLVSRTNRWMVEMRSPRVV